MSESSSGSCSSDRFADEQQEEARFDNEDRNWGGGDTFDQRRAGSSLAGMYKGHNSVAPYPACGSSESNLKHNLAP